jgi:hypothetical protein
LSGAIGVSVGSDRSESSRRISGGKAAIPLRETFGSAAALQSQHYDALKNMFMGARR